MVSRQMSMEGVRELAKALEGCRRQDVTHVYVHREGRIDVLGRRSGNRGVCEVVCSAAEARRDQRSQTLHLFQRRSVFPTPAQPFAPNVFSFQGRDRHIIMK